MNERDRIRRLEEGIREAEQAAPSGPDVTRAMRRFRATGELPPAGPLRDLALLLLRDVRAARATMNLPPQAFDELLD
ncbi:MAG: hypothetical protein RL148_1774 [Planctomycetota bacterium]|jgi:hypothetical protein